MVSKFAGGCWQFPKEIYSVQDLWTFDRAIGGELYVTFYLASQRLVRPTGMWNYTSSISRIHHRILHKYGISSNFQMVRLSWNYSKKPERSNNSVNSIFICTVRKFVSIRVQILQKRTIQICPPPSVSLVRLVGKNSCTLTLITTVQKAWTEHYQKELQAVFWQFLIHIFSFKSPNANSKIHVKEKRLQFSIFGYECKRIGEICWV